MTLRGYVPYGLRAVMSRDSLIHSDFGAIWVVCLFVYLTFFLYFLLFLWFFLLVYFLAYLSNYSRIDPFRFLALVFLVYFMLPCIILLRMHGCICCLFQFFSTKLRDWLGRTSPKCPILCRVRRKILNSVIQSVNQYKWEGSLNKCHLALVVHFDNFYSRSFGINVDTVTVLL